MANRWLKQVLMLAVFGCVAAPILAQQPQADLTVTKTARPDPVSVGGKITYTVTVTNGGPDTAVNVILTDPMTVGVKLAAVMLDVGAVGSCRWPRSVVMCHLGDLANGDSAAVTIVVRTTAAEVIPRRATVRSDTPDPDPGNNISGEEPAAAAAREEPAAEEPAAAPEEPAAAPEEPAPEEPAAAPEEPAAAPEEPAAAPEEPAPEEPAPEEPAPEEGCLDDPEQAQNALEEAQRLYRLELFIEAVQLLAPCVPLLDKPLKIEALRLMAIAHYESGEPDSSRQWVRQLVRRVDRGYRVDLAEDPLFFQDLVRQLRPKWYQKRWVQVSGGVVLGVVLGYVLFRPEVRPPGPLAGPPVFPPPSQ